MWEIEEVRGLNEWTTALKIGVICILAVGLISVAITFAFTGTLIEGNVKENVEAAYDTNDELYKFDNVWLDRQSAFNFACSCIDKDVILKIDSAIGGINTIDLYSPDVRKNIEDCVDRDRFKVKISESGGKATVFLSRG